MPSHMVAPTASEKASWMPATMAGMSGSTSAWN